MDLWRNVLCVSLLCTAGFGAKEGALCQFGSVLTLSVITTTLDCRMTTTRKPARIIRRTGVLEEQVFINLMLTSDLLARRLEPVLKAAEISPTQYNVLRILRGAPEGLTCGEIASRMITRDPDITRLLDRLEKRALVSRCRQTRDRRMVLTRITDAGLKLLSQLDAPVLDAHHLLLGHLGPDKLRNLLKLLEAARPQSA